MRQRGETVRRAFLLGAVVAAACGDASAGDPGAAEGGAGTGFVRVINVEVQTVAPERFIEEILLTGTVAAEQDVTVAAEESGAVLEIVRDKGERVRTGDAVLRIDDRVLRAQVDQARAAAQLAEETWTRRRRLWEEDRVGSELAYLEARFAAEQSAATLRGLEERLARTVIRAPFAGVLEDRMVEVGSLVAAGTPVFRVVDADPVKIRAGVPERYAPDVRPGTAADVTFDVLPEAGGLATVDFVGSAVDPRNRTFPVEFRLPNPQLRIKPEMVANVTLERSAVEGALAVPQDALVRLDDGYVVFVVEGEGEQTFARRRRVELGSSRGNRVVVTAGLEAGERLVVVGQKSVADGDRVRVVEGS
ncbi:MAG: efflux RND transporter periplasmic adaptor subunit [Longimicrobiales bacterium]|nr:efflux RND transporter periplasmic adaptor subunit [Longimicrobiales bacterium]